MLTHETFDMILCECKRNLQCKANRVNKPRTGWSVYRRHTFLFVILSYYIVSTRSSNIQDMFWKYNFVKLNAQHVHRRGDRGLLLITLVAVMIARAAV